MDIEKLKEEIKKYGLNPSEDAVFVSTFIVDKIGDKLDKLENRLDKLEGRLSGEIRDTRNILVAMIGISIGALIGFGIAILFALL